MKKEKYAFDFSKLRGKIREVLSQEQIFAKKIGISTATLSSRFNNTTDFTGTEIMLACDVLKIPKEEIDLYFFTLKVE